MSGERRFYDDYWRDPAAASPMHDALGEPRLRLFLPLVPPGARILDAGCGAGRETRALAERANGVVGLDVSPAALAAACASFPAGRWVCASLEEDLPLASACFDAIYFCETIEHLLNVSRALREFHRLLVPGGLLFLSTPYHGLLKNLAIALVAFERHFNPTGAHIRFFSPRSLARALEAAGFRVEGLRRLGRFWPVWMDMVVWARKV